MALICGNDGIGRRAVEKGFRRLASGAAIAQEGAETLDRRHEALGGNGCQRRIGRLAVHDKADATGRAAQRDGRARRMGATLGAAGNMDIDGAIEQVRRVGHHGIGSGMRIEACGCAAGGSGADRDGTPRRLIRAPEAFALRRLLCGDQPFFRKAAHQKGAVRRKTKFRGAAGREALNEGCKAIRMHLAIGRGDTENERTIDMVHADRMAQPGFEPRLRLLLPPGEKVAATG